MSGVSDRDEHDFDLVAAEYVIGTLDGAERLAFGHRLATDLAAKRAVEGWERRLAGLAGSLDPSPVAPDVWPRIERAINASAARGPSPGPRSIVEPAARPFELIDGGAFLATPRLRASRNRWRAAALLSGSIAAALLVFVGERSLVGPELPPESLSYVAAVNRGGDKPALIVRVDLRTHQVFVRPVAAETPAGHSLELWYIGDNKPPRSMGLVDGAPETMQVPTGTDATKASFAVSVEPPGGSKTGAPTGPVVYSGSLVRE